ncbi:MAG: hypothetical protein QNK18_09825 [Gammaproteobacteria bacterium]|nr:hypothetical protein [Gammaproteobacteria bacterium]
MQTLLSIVELGGYPDFSPLYRTAGYQVVIARSMRKALALTKKHRPDVIVAEFNYQSDFRDRTSNLESLLATLQTRCPEAKTVVFYESAHSGHLERLLARFSVHATHAFPIDTDQLLASLREA